jgi:hypothetical protein
MLLDGTMDSIIIIIIIIIFRAAPALEPSPCSGTLKETGREEDRKTAGEDL